MTTWVGARPHGRTSDPSFNKVRKKAVTVHCAECGAYICRGGNREAAPDDCPMKGEFPEFENLYPQGQTRDFLVQSALVEAEGYCRWTRVREVVEFSNRMGFRRLGLPHCSDMSPISERVAKALSEAGLEPVLPLESSPCDPLAQAGFFAEAETEMNVLSGMCVGHETLFIQASSAPVVGLVARDTRLKHNPAAGIYTSRSYLKKELFGHWSPKNRPPFQGWTTETLGRVAEEVKENGKEPRSRLAEAMEFAHRMGASHLGISFCVGFRQEAAVLSKLLQTNGFRVSSVCCKTGSTPKEEAGIQDAQKVRPGTREMICNPLAQAELLNRDQVEFVMVLGQCVGHDAATFKALDAPAICLVAKDRVLAHNSVAALP